MSQKHTEIAELLIDLESNLRNMGLWSEERPSEEALSSQTPFCVDTLDFEQWLQFVFIEKMNVLVEWQLPLPDKCGLAPMAEEYFRGAPRSPTVLIGTLQAIDRSLSR